MMFRLPVDSAGPGAPPGDRGEAPRPRREFETKLCRSGGCLRLLGSDSEGLELAHLELKARVETPRYRGISSATQFRMR